MGTQLLPKKGAQHPHFPANVLWPNGWMDQLPLGMEVRLGPGHTVRWGAKGDSPPIFGPSLLWIVLDGDPAPPKRSTAPPLLFGSCVLLPNGWMDQDATWYGGGPQPRPHCVKWAPSSPQKGSQQPPPSFDHVYFGQTVAHLSYWWAFGFIHIYCHAVFFTLSFHSLSLLIRSLLVSVITAKSSAYNSSYSKFSWYGFHHNHK